MTVCHALTLPAALDSVARARAFLRELCHERDLRPAMCDDAVLLTSELVANAILHGRSEVLVEVDWAADRLRVSVHDENSRWPSRVADDPDALDGRGLSLVAEIADEWGVRDEPTGKAVWFALALG